MDTNVAKQMIDVIRAERQCRARKAAQLANDDPEFASDQWLFTDEPFVNELCLILLVAVWHQVERELIWLAARVTGDGKEISGEKYLQNVKRKRKLFGKDRTNIIEKLKLNDFSEWKSSMETLRLLANCYKHDPSRVPDEKLLKHLEPDESHNYASLPESSWFREELAAYVNLPKNSDYCDIAEKLVDCAAGFLAELQKKTVVSRVEWGPVNFGDPSFYSG